MLFRSCFFQNHNISVIGQDGGGSGFCNGVTISNTLFGNYNTAAIANGGQDWRLDQCICEQNVDGKNQFIYSTKATTANAAKYQLIYISNGTNTYIHIVDVTTNLSGRSQPKHLGLDSRLWK